jgi:hypothetical protein
MILPFRFRSATSLIYLAGVRRNLEAANASLQESAATWRMFAWC